MPFWSWSKAAASNATADATINWAEGQSPSSVNDSARAMMARTAEWRDDVSGTIATAGTSTAYTVASNQGFDSLAHLDGAMIAFVPHITNGGGAGTPVTLNVDGLGAKPLRYGPSKNLESGFLIQGTPYVATYNNSDGAFYLRGFNANPYGVPIGCFLPSLIGTVPNSCFALPIGQTLSRTTYATLFALVSTTYGAGDGSTTFGIPDLRGRAIFGLDNMGGTAANRVTSAGSGINGSGPGATGGAQNHTLTTAEVPVGIVTLNFNDPGHVHAIGEASAAAGAAFESFVVSGNPPNSLGSSAGPIASNTTGISASLTDHAGGGAHAIMPPTIMLPYILRVI